MSSKSNRKVHFLHRENNTSVDSNSTWGFLFAHVASCFSADKRNGKFQKQSLYNSLNRHYKVAYLLPQLGDLKCSLIKKIICNYVTVNLALSCPSLNKCLKLSRRLKGRYTTAQGTKIYTFKITRGHNPSGHHCTCDANIEYRHKHKRSLWAGGDGRT